MQKPAAYNMPHGAVFLDRDGVLNDVVLVEGVPRPPRTLAQLSILPGVEMACNTLRAAGLPLICVTNQPDLARGSQTRDHVDAINQALAVRLGLDIVLVCDHDDQDNCSCRKPKPGLLVAAAQQFHINLQLSIMVGDRWRDIAAGKAAGCRTVFIDHGYQELQPHQPDLVVDSLAAAVPWILSQEGERK